MKNLSFSPLLLGIDIGTTDTKCSFYDLNGCPVASCIQEYPMVSSNPGLAEEDPNLWWQAVISNIHDCIQRQNINPDRVKAIGVSDTNTFFPVDKYGNALHNAILQIDQRTDKQVEWAKNNLNIEQLFKITGNRIARGTFSLPTVRWFIENKPEIIEKAYKFLVPSGYIIQKLTGVFSINESRMCFTLLGNIRTGDWDKEIVDKVGLNFQQLPKVYKATDIVGSVSRTASTITGLKEGTPVIAGSMDTVSAAVGVGSIHVGDIFLAVGTCGRLCYINDGRSFDNRLMNCRNAFNGKWVSIEATNAAGASLRWFRDLFGSGYLNEAQREHVSIYSIFDKMAEESPPGSNGLIYFPYLSGERAPIWDSNARGLFWGMSLANSFGDFIRAIMEGVVYSLKQGLDIVLNEGQAPDCITLGGGVSNSNIWSHIFADILEIPIKKLVVNETETLGDAIMAGVGIGLITDPVEIPDSLLKNAEIIYPNLANHDIYDANFNLFNNIYKSIKPYFNELKK